MSRDNSRPRKKNIKNWAKVAIALLVIIIVFANPFLRSIVHFILPLGSGIDDVIEIIALVGLVVLLVYKISRNKGKIVDWFYEDDNDY